MKLVFFETLIFTRLLPIYLDDESYRALQRLLLTSPEAGAVMPGTGGFRKLRWEDPRREKGKRVGLRIIYYYLTADLRSGSLRFTEKMRPWISAKNRRRR